MTVECPLCKTRYQLDETKLGGRTQVHVRCSKCSITFPVSIAAGSAPPPPAEAEVTRPSQPGAALTLPTDKRLALSVTTGPDKGKVHAITKTRMVLGRAGSDIVVDDTEVSRRHCALEVHGVKVQVVDLGSTNGTYAAGERVESCELEHMNEFRIGSTTFMFTVFDKA